MCASAQAHLSLTAQHDFTFCLVGVIQWGRSLNAGTYLTMCARLPVHTEPENLAENYIWRFNG